MVMFRKTKSFDPQGAGLASCAFRSARPVVDLGDFRLAEGGLIADAMEYGLQLGGRRSSPYERTRDIAAWIAFPNRPNVR